MSEIKNEVEKTNEEVKDLASTVKDENAAAEVTTEDKAAKEEEVKAAEQTAEKTDTEKKSGPDLEPFNCRIIVVTSGKGGVGKTTSSAAIATGLALKGHKTAVIDFDVGLRNLDLVMGCERRVVYDLINVVHKEARLNQALIKDRHVDNLYILPASQTKDKDALTLEGVGEVLRGLDNAGFEYVVCDSPAGIEAGALMALYYADEAVVTTNPEVSSVRDSDRIIGILNSKSRRAVLDWEPVTSRLLLTRYVPGRVTKNEMLSVEDVQELLTIPLLGVIPESPDVLKASNAGNSIILNKESDAGKAYEDAVERLLGNEVELRFTTEKKGFFSKLFKR
ncbi:septum site-determining protein MinD [Succinatimonas hippei]|uniref:septum site-determining protein MinD n=1 Tax=Succinatimonas hippei TaxID=626938 RepID=UPI0023FA400E|nr:septum site-determining protein MinD [Succinatimonas hippei]